MEQWTPPLIDWEQAVKVAGNNRELAEDIFKGLLRTLPDERAAIKKLYEEQNYPELLQRAHKLHGALCYCGLPRLKSVIENLETELKRNIMVNLPSLLERFDTEVSLLLERCPRP